MTRKEDIINAVKNLDVFLKVDALRGAVAFCNSNGSLFFYAGGFNLVFQLTVGKKIWAFRVWFVPFGEHKERFQSIEKYFNKKKLPYFSDFVYDKNGILVNGKLVDTIRMEWVEGTRLKGFIEQNLNDKTTLKSLALSFLKMCENLRDNQISHGDLQDGNILIDSSGQLRLVDYDSVCIPSIEGQNELVSGLKGYQHPSRTDENNKNKCSLLADYFSELIIYLSIIGIAEKPDLWYEYKVRDTQVLLFSEQDFSDLQRSKIYKSLKNISSEIDQLLIILESYLKQDSYLKLRQFKTYIILPEIKFFNIDKGVIILGQEIVLTWEVENADSIEIDNHVGKVSSIGKFNLKPITDTVYGIIAINPFGSSSSHISLKVFPAPVMEYLKIPMPEFESKVTINNINLKTVRFDLSCNLPNLNYQKPAFIQPSIKIRRIHPKFKPFKSHFNLSSVYGAIKHRLLG